MSADFERLDGRRFTSILKNNEQQPISMLDRISIDPRIHFGKPCVRDTRIPVHNVLELVREGIPFPQIISDYYPDLTEEDIRSCVQYAMDIVAVEDIHVAATP